MREEIARRKEEFGRSYLLFPVDHSELVRIFLWEGNVEAAWREAKEGGCSNELWLELATGREENHPEDSLSIYEARIEPLIVKDEQCSLPGGLRAAAQGTPSDAEAGSRAGVRRVSGVAPCRVQTQAQLHEAPQRDGIRTSTFVARRRRCTRLPGST